MPKRLTMTLALVALLVALLLKVSATYKTVLFALAALLLLYSIRSYFYVVLASQVKKKSGSESPRVWNLYRRALHTGLPAKYAVMLSNLFIQQGDPKEALEMLNSFIEKEWTKKKPNQFSILAAKNSISMALYILGDLEGAIDALQNMREKGEVDTNLYTNLSSYLLESDLVEEAEEVLRESEEHVHETPALLDNKGWVLLKQHRYEEADELYQNLINDLLPRFPEAYVHAAMAKEAQGEYEAAEELYQRALTKEFYRSAGYSKKEVEQRLKSIQAGDYRQPFLDVEWLESHEYDDDDLFDDEERSAVDDVEEEDSAVELDFEDYRDNYPPVEYDKSIESLYDFADEQD